MNAEHLAPSILITHRYPVERAADAISALRADVTDDEPRDKIVISLT